MAKPQLEDGRTEIANELVEALAKYNFSAYESRILWVIFRKTYGWHKKTDRISYTQFQESTGIDRRHIGRTITSLKSRNIITCNGNGYSLEYGIQKDYELWDLTPKEATIIDTNPGNDLTPKEAIVDKNNLTPIQGDLTPIQGEPLPKEATKSLPKEANTKAIKHIQKHITKAIPTIPTFINLEIWNAFLEMRKKQKALPTDYAITLILKKLENLKLSGDNPNEVLQQSIMNNWKGVFALKGKQEGKSSGTHKGYSQLPTDEQLEKSWGKHGAKGAGATTGGGEENVVP